MLLIGFYVGFDVVFRVGFGPRSGSDLGPEIRA